MAQGLVLNSKRIRRLGNLRVRVLREVGDAIVFQDLHKDFNDKSRCTFSFTIFSIFHNDKRKMFYICNDNYKELLDIKRVLR